MKSIEEIVRSNLKLIKSMLQEGRIDKEIYEKIGISKTTWNKYKVACGPLKEIIEEVKDNRNREVEEKLFKLCTGYDYEEEVAFKCKEEFKDGNEILVKEVVKVTSVKKKKLPDLNAQKYWLNNKKKGQWKEDPHKVELGKKSLKIKEKLAEKEEW